MAYRKEMTFGNVKVVQRSDSLWGVVDLDDNVIVPFGKYAWIDGFDHGLARVHTKGDSGRKTDVNSIEFLSYKKSKHAGEEITFADFLREDRKKNPYKYAKWGIINERGEEVLSVEYDSVWNFYGKNRKYTKVEKDGKSHDVYFHDLNPLLPSYEMRNRNCHGDDYGTHYGEFAGSYAQDVMGYSDDVINDAFEGDPDAYWNID